jgi:hypothetical protein
VLELGGTTTVVFAGGGGLLLLMQPDSTPTAINDAISIFIFASKRDHTLGILNLGATPGAGADSARDHGPTANAHVLPAPTRWVNIVLA